MKQPEYIEGPEALENFKEFGRMILQAPKPERKTKKKTEATIPRKSKGTE